MLIKLLLAILANLKGYLSCAKGCLICRKSKCLLCDSAKNYYLVDSSCVFKTIDNCFRSNDGEACLTCNSGFYPDSQTGNCFPIDNPDPNCVYYADKDSCALCTATYFPASNNSASGNVIYCKKSDIIVPNCTEYSGNGQCATCGSGFLSDESIDINAAAANSTNATENSTNTTAAANATASLTVNSCRPFADPNCQESGMLACLACVPTFELNKNTYLSMFNNATTSTLKKTSLGSLTAVKGYQFSSCAKENLPKCLEYKTFDSCQTCSAGYFVNPSGQCELLPEEAIDNCQEYYTALNCRTCLEGYYKASEISCLPHAKTIKNCMVMDQTTPDLCYICQEGFFLASNICNDQTLVDNCLYYQRDQDFCAICLDNFQLSADGLVCAPAIEKCIEYSFNDRIATCSKCDAGFYPTDQGCIAVSLSFNGCEFYDKRDTPDANNLNYQCASCKNLYYMDNGVCKQHDAFIGSAVNCRLTNSTVKNTCASCGEDEQMNEVLNYCESFDKSGKIADENCQSYNSSAICTQCQSGYFLDVTNVCVKIQMANCQDADTPTFCNKCSSSQVENFFPSATTSPNKCIFSYKHVINNCQTADDTRPDTQNKNTNICSNCYAPFYPEELLEAQFCVPIVHIRYNYGSVSQLNNCRVYAPLGTVINSCLACSFNTALNLQKVLFSNNCWDNCTVSGFNIKTNVDGQFFVCSKALISSCLREDGLNCATCSLFSFPQVNSDTILNHFSTFDYLPANETGHFQSKSFISSSQFNKVPLFASCLTAQPAKGMQHDAGTTNSGNLYPVFIAAADYSQGTSAIYSLCKGALTVSASGTVNFGCAVCKFGFTGFFVADSSGNQFISNCFLNKDCNYGVYYEGIGSQLATADLHFFVGCHKCNNDTLIATFARFQRFTDAAVGSVPGTTVPSGSSKYYPQTSCLQRGFVSGNTLFPAKCQVQEIFGTKPVSLYSSGTLKDANPACVACQPGYKPTLETATKVIRDCVEITNCDKAKGTTTFNKCTQCLPNFVLNANMDACLPNTISNCYIGTDGSAGSPTCTTCKQQYLPTHDNRFCNLVITENCLQFDFFAVGANGGPYTGKNCLNCELGYVATKFSQAQRLCIGSDEIANRKFNFIGVENCYVYKSSNECAQCLVGFILPEGVTNNCIISSKVLNCKIYNADTTCKVCQQGFFLQSENCIDGSIYISNCLEFASKTVCNTCASGFVAIAQGGKTSCYNAAQTLTNCITFNAASALLGNLKCDLCAAGYYPKTIGYSFQGCLQIPQIAHCQYYNVASFDCINCFDNYYLENPTDPSGIQRCLKRTRNDPACDLPDPSADRCLICSSGYSVRNDSCTFRPSGIRGCEVYLDSQTCSKCRSGYYFLGNECREVLAENLVDNCRFYSDNVTCSECLNGYLLGNSTCKPVLISNCQVLKSPLECLVCASGFFLTQTLACAAGNVDNCQVHASLSQCQACKTNFYVDADKKCSKVPALALITNCLVYASNQTCGFCSQGTILAKDGSACLAFDRINATSLEKANQDPNCDSYIYQYNCRVCKGGYLFSDGLCTLCNVNQPNCYFCDPKNETNCFVCQSGFYQDDSGRCLSNVNSSSIIVTDGGSGNNTNNTNQTKFVSGIVIERWMWLVFLAALFHNHLLFE